MKTTFNKTLLAVALAGFGVSAQAAVVSQETTAYGDYSKQYVQTVDADTVVTAGFDIELAAEYKNDDIVTITFTSDLGPDYVAPSSVVAAPGVANNSIVTLGLLSQTANVLTYRVTDITTGTNATTVGNILSFVDVEFEAGTLNSVADIKATYKATTASGNFTIDSGKDNTAKILAAADQFEAEVTQAIEGLIALPDRNSLATNDGLVTTFADDALNLRDAVTLDDITYVLEGDFSWIKDTAAGAGLQTAAVVVPAGCAYEAASSSATALTVTCDNTPTALTVDFDIAANTAAAGVPASAATAATVATTLKKTDYTVTATANYSGTASGEFVALNEVAAGKWRVDGVEVDVPYLVKGTLGAKTFSHVVNARNNHSAAGNVTIDVYAQDGTVLGSNVDAGSIAPNQVKELSGAINAVLGNSFNGKFSVTVFIEVPANSGSQVYSAYVDNSTSERAIVVNSSN